MPGPLRIFVLGTAENKHLFNLLKRAYIDARCDPKYRITRAELEYISARVKKLHGLTKKICKQKIASFLESQGLIRGRGRHPG